MNIFYYKFEFSYKPSFVMYLIEGDHALMVHGGRKRTGETTGDFLRFFSNLNLPQGVALWK